MRRAVIGAAVVATATAGAAATPLHDELSASAEAVLARAAETGAVDPAVKDLKRICDQAVGFAPLTDLDTITDTTRAWLIAAYAAMAGDRGAEVVRALVDHPTFASHLVFAWNPARDNEEEGGRLLVRLAQDRAAQVDAHPALAAALVLVHDVPGGVTRQINENSAKSADPVAIFDYFVANEGRLAVDPDTLPVELLMHVVDTTSSPDDLAWALQQYGRRPDPGRRFFEIDYDYDYFARGTEKKLTASGRFDLRAIKQLGGVCADQAYFAEEVGKACGVPTVYVRAQGAEVGHAWIGFLEVRGKRAAWNLDAGRYDAYRNLRGTVQIAGTNEWETDSEVRLGAGLVGERDADRWAARAVAIDVWAWTQQHSVAGDRPEADGALAAARTSKDVGAMLALVRAGVDRSAYTAQTWDVVAALGERGALSMDQLDEWGTALDRLCGRAYADFSVEVLGKMIKGIASAEDKLRMWDWVHDRFGSRPDLAATIRIEQARLAEQLGQHDKAWWALMDVVDKHAGDAPEVVTAVQMARDMLDANGKSGEVAGMLDRAWRKIPRPQQMAGAFRVQSNWFRVGAMYYNAVKASDPRKAEDIQRELSR